MSTRAVVPGTGRVRVLHFTWRVSRTGGIPVLVRALLRSTDRSRFEVHLCTVRPAFPEDGLEELEGVHLHPLGVSGPVTPAKRARVLLGLARLVWRLSPDVLHVHSGVAWYSLPAVVLRRHMGRVLDLFDPPQTRRLRPRNARLEGVMVRRLGYRVVAHSESGRHDIAAAYGLEPASMAVLHAGIELGPFAAPRVGAARWRSDHGIPEAAPVVLYVARLVESKNPRLFLDVAEEVARSHPRAVFVLAGSGPLREELSAEVETRDLGRTVRVVGEVQDIASAHHAADVFLSTSDAEGFGLAIVEAMAVGRPVVATAVGGVTDVIEDGVSGLLAPPGDKAELARLTSRLLGDADLREALGSRAASRARARFDSAQMARRYEELYLEVARSRPAPGGAPRPPAGGRRRRKGGG